MFPWILLLWFSVISFLLCFLLSAQVVRRHHSSLLEVECGSARWLTHHLGEHIFLGHHLYVYTSGVPPPALVTQWPPLWCSLETKITKDWSTVGIIWCLSACLGPSIILDVTMVSSAEIPQYFSLFKETWEASGFVLFSCRIFLWKLKWKDYLNKKVLKKPKKPPHHCIFLKDKWAGVLQQH